MALIGEMKYLTIGDNTYSVPSSGGGGGGTVTSVQVQATSPVQSSNSSAQSAVLNTTISLANGYGDTKNPYASKSKNQVLATPTNASGAPSFRALDASDIPDLSDDYLPADTSIPTKVSDLDNDSDFVEDASYVHTDNNFTATLKNKLDGIAAGAEVNVQANWSQTTTTADDYIKNKPTIPTTTSQLTNNSGFITSAALPTKVSDLDNDSGFITGYTETDPTVPAWAKAASKPSYTASEVGAQETLVSGTNIKTVGGTSVLGSGDIPLLTLDTIYPVGSIYMSVNNTDPSTLFGGTWVQIKDTFLLAAGDTYAGGATGGEATHTLTAAESGVPAHGHGFTQPKVTIGAHQHTPYTGSTTTDYFVTTEESGANNTKVTYSSSGNRWVDGLTVQSHFHHRVATTSADLGTKTATGGAVQNNTAANATTAHNNMPPYLSVYVWQRTA